MALFPRYLPTTTYLFFKMFFIYFSATLVLEVDGNHKRKKKGGYFKHCSSVFFISLQ